MKKLLLAGLTLAGIAVIGASACSPAPANGERLSTAEDVYALGAVSTVKLLGNAVTGETVQGLSTVKALAVTDGVQTNDVKDYAEKFNEYFCAFDEFLGNDILTTYAVENTDADYDYEIKLTVTGKDLDGNDVTHVLYYTETLSKEYNHGNSTNTAYTLEGVMVVDGSDYYLTGEREYESGGRETEEELKIRAYADPADKRTYVEMKQETSVEANETEREYTYSIYADGRLVEKTSVEFETESKRDREEVAYKLEFINGEGKGKYIVERVTVDGFAQMSVKYDISGDKGQFLIRRTTDGDGQPEYEYVFSDKSSKKFKVK